MPECVNCGGQVDEVCPDGYCRKCHHDLSFEDCCDGTFTAKVLLNTGLPKEYVLEAYPKARME